MENSIFNEIANFLQNHSDGKKIVDQSNLSASEVHKVAKEVVPKITEQVKNNPDTLGDMFKIFSQNKDNPNSLLNTKSGFDQQKAQDEGNQLLQAIFGSGQTSKIADDVAQKTGVSVMDITGILPMITGMATKLLGNKVDSIGSTASASDPKSSANQLFGFLDITPSGDLGRIGQQIMSNLFKGQNNRRV
jgi:hypothetical protein